MQVNPFPPSDAVRQQKKNIFEDLLSSILSQSKKYHSENLKFYNLGISKSLKLRILEGKILPISLKLNFTPNTLGSKGLNTWVCFRCPMPRFACELSF